MITVSPAWLSIVISIGALCLAFMSWRTSKTAAKASIFDRRFEVFIDTERFLKIWSRDGHPDLTELPTLVNAWNRSHFLFSKDVTKYLRRLWLDAIEAEQAQNIISGEEDGDRKNAVKTKYDLFKQHCSAENLRMAFLKELKL